MQENSGKNIIFESLNLQLYIFLNKCTGLACFNCGFEEEHFFQSSHLFREKVYKTLTLQLYDLNHPTHHSVWIT